MIVGNLGDEEILMCACDDGDVVVYYTEKINNMIKGISNGLSAEESIVRYLQPLLCYNVGKSAWGLAIHTNARLLAVSSNTHFVTVFSFALVDVSILDHDSETNSNVETRWRHKDVMIRLEGHETNIPNISFFNSPQDKEGRYLASTDLTGLILIWDLRSRRIVREIHPQTSRIPYMSGWSVVCLDPACFRDSSSDAEALGDHVVNTHGTIEIRNTRAIPQFHSLTGTAYLDHLRLGHALFHRRPDRENRSRNGDFNAWPRNRGGSADEDAPYPDTGYISDEGDDDFDEEEDSEDEDDDEMEEDDVDEEDENDDLGLDLPAQIANESTDASETFSELERASDALAGHHQTPLDSRIRGNNLEVIRNIRDQLISFGESLGHNRIPLNPNTQSNNLQVLQNIRNQLVSYGESMGHNARRQPRYPSGPETRNQGALAGSSEPPFLIFHTGERFAQLHQYPFRTPVAICRDPCYSCDGIGDRTDFDRLNLTIHIPELSIVITGTPDGHVAIFTLTKRPKSCANEAKVETNFGMRLDWVLPLYRQREASGWPSRPPTLGMLVGMAAAPLQSDNVPERRSRRWRLLLTYQSHTVFSYELWRGDKDTTELKQALLL